MTDHDPLTTRSRDWGEIFRHLIASGLTYGFIASKCNRHASTLAQWAKGTEPRESDARVVLTLLARHCPIEYLRQQQVFGVLAPKIPDESIEDREG